MAICIVLECRNIAEDDGRGLCDGHWDSYCSSGILRSECDDCIQNHLRDEKHSRENGFGEACNCKTCLDHSDYFSEVEI